MKYKMAKFINIGFIKRFDGILMIKKICHEINITIGSIINSKANRRVTACDVISLKSGWPLSVSSRKAVIFIEKSLAKALTPPFSE